MQLILIALVAALMGGKVDASTILSIFSEPSEQPSEGDVDAEIIELLGHITGSNLAEVIKTAGILGEVIKTLSPPARKVYEAEEPQKALTKKLPADVYSPLEEEKDECQNKSDKIPDGGVATLLAPVKNIAAAEILHALSAAF